MHDAVADVLLERQALSRSSPFGFFASIVLHAGLALLLVLAARSRTARPTKPVVMIRLAASSSGAPSASISRMAAPARKKTPAPAPREKEKSEAPESPKKATRPVEKALFGKSTEKTSAPAKGSAPAGRTAKDPAATGDAGGSEFAVPGIGTAGVTGIEGGDFPYTIYIDRMIALIGNHWFRPQLRGDALTRVYFVIERDGRIRDARIEQTSGVSVFDRAALRAVIEASPLPPLPFGYAGTYLGVHLTFH